MKPVVKQIAPFRWDGIEVRPYKPESPESTHFRDISRQVLFGPDTGLAAELRYFEIERDGHSTLERHEHVHAVVIVRGRGRVLVGSDVFDVEPLDLVSVPPLTWHQLRPDGDEPLGFLCLVAASRDRPTRPDPEELAELRASPTVAAFVRT